MSNRHKRQRVRTRAFLVTQAQLHAQADAHAAWERSADLNAEWLAANYAGTTQRPSPAHTRPVREVIDPNSDYAMYRRFEAMDEHNETPDPLGKTGHYEPKSIYSPAPASRIRFERPKKRAAPDRSRPGPDPIKGPETFRGIAEATGIIERSPQR